MKSLIPNFFEGVVCAFGAMSLSNFSIFAKQPLINSEFLEQFTSQEDKELLDKTVRDLKNSGRQKEEIELSNNERITIVVD